LKSEKFLVHVVDPDQAIAEGLATLLNTYGIEVCSYPDAETFLNSWSQLRPGHCCLLVEAELPGLSGPALVQILLDEFADLPVLLLINTSSPELIETARRSTRFGVIEKPFVNGTLIEQVLRLRQAA
jgi:two-component system CheB/CheR fusion protein